MFENLQPLGDKVLVKRVDFETQTPGGIFIPDSAAKEKAQHGTVLAVGPGRTTADGKIIPMGLKKGDTVFFGKYVGTEAGNDYLILREEDILGVMNK